MKPDKLPTLNPNERGIFDLIVRTVAQIRKERQTREYREGVERRELDAVAFRKRREFEAKVAASRAAQE